MTNLDAHVASVLDAAPSDDEDALIASLEDSPALDAFREQRLQQLHSELARARAQKNQGFGSYTEIKEEKTLMELTTEVKYAVVHFAKDDFSRCGDLAKKHFDTRFLKINVDNAPFLVTKLKIQILPCVLSFIDGVSVDRTVGFEGLGSSPDVFTTKDLEGRLLACGVVQRAKAANNRSIKYGVKDVQGKYTMSDDDDDDE